MTDRKVSDARAAELARLIAETRTSVGPLGHNEDRLDALAAWLLSHGENLLADRAADRAECERLQRLLRLRGRQMETATRHWVRAAEEALAGDTRALRLRVDMARAAPVDVVLSDADPAVLARHAAVQAGDLSGTVDWPDPRDAVVEAARALAENIGWRGYGPDVGHYYCEHCDKKATSVAQIPHTDGCRAKRLLDALAALDAAGRQGGREP